MSGGGSAPLWLERWHLDEPAVAKTYKHYLLNTKAGVLPRRQENLLTRLPSNQVSYLRYLHVHWHRLTAHKLSRWLFWRKTWEPDNKAVSVVDCDADHTKSHLCRCLKVHNHCLDGAVGALRCCLGRRFGAPPQGVIGHLQAYSTICNRCVGWICTSIWPGLLGSKYYFKQPSTSVPNEGESMPDELVSNDGSLLAMDQSIVFVVHW